jgi:hypothetical protein
MKFLAYLKLTETPGLIFHLMKFKMNKLCAKLQIIRSLFVKNDQKLKSISTIFTQMGLRIA